MLSGHGFQFLSLYTAVHFTGFIIKYYIVSAEFLGGMMFKSENHRVAHSVLPFS
jgi:hypothetical protein